MPRAVKGMKKCSKCRKIKSIYNFGPNKGRVLDGLSSWCKKCENIDSKKWYKKHYKRVYDVQKQYDGAHPIAYRFGCQKSYLREFEKIKKRGVRAVQAFIQENGYPDWEYSWNLPIEIKLAWDSVRPTQLCRAWLYSRKGKPYRIRLLLPTDRPSLPIDFPNPQAYIEAMKHAAAEEKLVQRGLNGER